MDSYAVGEKLNKYDMVLLSVAFIAYSRDVVMFRNQSRKTEEHLFVAMKSLINYLGDIPINELDFEKVRRWKECLEKRNLSSETIRGYLSKLRVVLAYCRKQGVECLDPELIPLPKHTHNVPVFITPEEVSKLIVAVGCKKRGYPSVNRYRNQAIISLLYASGIRIGELCRMNRGDIYKGSFTVTGKGGKSRLCFVDDRTEKLLVKYLSLRTDDIDALFLANQTKKRIKPGNVQKMMRYGWRKAGISKPVHPHSLRHSFATDLLRHNANPRYVQALLGHSSLETTQMYMSVVDNDLMKIYKRYHRV